MKLVLKWEFKKMRNENEIRSRLDDLIKRRLKNRYKMKMGKDYHNCEFAVPQGRFYVCTHKVNLTPNKHLLCGDECIKCKLYSHKYNKQKIKEEFIAEISDPNICMQNEPKIAMLTWVLQDYSLKRSFWKRLFGRKK